MIRLPIARFLVTCGAALACLGATAADLTAAEMRWVRGIWPVVTFARAERLPLDLVLQPQPTPGAAPLAMAFIEGRCKLVLSMRGNPQAEAPLAQIDPGFLDTALELMAAHELGHCRRYLDGAWHGLPHGFAPALPAGLSPALRRRRGRSGGGAARGSLRRPGGIGVGSATSSRTICASACLATG